MQVAIRLQGRGSSKPKISEPRSPVSFMEPDGRFHGIKTILRYAPGCITGGERVKVGVYIAFDRSLKASRR